jgi:TetR/AcrR family transcriptional repressor of nem operon
MARPREFDIDDATERAMALFWSRGYEGSSLSDLLEVMLIARGSLYKAYGDKRAVWLAALNHYDQTVVQPTAAALADASAGPGLARIAALLDAPASAVREHDERRGCFLCNAAVDRGPEDKDGRARVLAMFERLETGLRAALGDEAARQDWTPEMVALKASMTLSVYVGLRVLVRAGAPIASIEAIAAGHLATLTEN